MSFVVDKGGSGDCTFIIIFTKKKLRVPSSNDITIRALISQHLTAKVVVHATFGPLSPSPGLLVNVPRII